MRILEDRSLCNCKLKKNFNGSYTLSFDDETIVRDHDQMLGLLKKIKAKDSNKNPRSYRSQTYKDMMLSANKGSNLYVWKHDKKKIKGN